jgi:predicted XRE-type DNA-binding protein
MTILDDIQGLRDAADLISDADSRDDIATALKACGLVRDLLPEIATALVERGVKRGMSQRRMAELLGVPESTLRGARREFAR